jgi:hypothetical protein
VAFDFLATKTQKHQNSNLKISVKKLRTIRSKEDLNGHAISAKFTVCQNRILQETG